MTTSVVVDGAVATILFLPARISPLRRQRRDDELEAEGYARRRGRVQEACRAAGLHVSDRIALTSCPGAANGAVDISTLSRERRFARTRTCGSSISPIDVEKRDP